LVGFLKRRMEELIGQDKFQEPVRIYIRSVFQMKTQDMLLVIKG